MGGTILGALGFVMASVVCGWAGAHEAFLNGQRVDVAPWGENLWLRNRIVEHEGLSCISSRCLVASIVGIRSHLKRRASP